MGTKRIGLARVEALLENLKREINWGAGTDFKYSSNYDAAKGHERYYLETYFPKRPGLNANLDAASTVEVARALSHEFEVVGTNMTSALTTFSETYGGIKITTGGSDNDQTTVTPHLDNAGTGQTDAISAWAGVQWGTENQTEWACCITTDTITNV